MKLIMMNKYFAALACATLAIGACKDSTGVPNLNNPSVESVGGALSKANLQILMTGVLNQERVALDYPFLIFPGTLSRDIWRLDNSESRFISETLEGRPSPGGFLARGYTPYYTAVRAENNLLDAVPKATAELSTGDRAAIDGFVKTLKANDLYRVLETRDTLGLPIAVADPTVVAPIVCKPGVLAYLSLLLDSAYTDLLAAQSAGTTSFLATLPSGWTSIGGDYSLIANQIKYNRGLKGMIEVYRGLAGGSAANFTTAIAALNIALAGDPGTASSLAGGPYYQFSTLSGEITNPLFDTRVHFTPSVFDSIQPGDARLAKIVVQPTPATLIVDNVNFSTRYDPAVSVTSNPANQTRPIPILKNEELYLLRAQAKIGAGDLAGATADLNVIRTVSGELAPYAVFASQTAAIDAMLYEKRYSLLTDGAQRLVDLRAYNRLNAASFPPGPLSPYPGDPFNFVLPYPQAEIDVHGASGLKCQ
jgi:starch-binding outer membrane protein, SusD/RagB family